MTDRSKPTNFRALLYTGVAVAMLASGSAGLAQTSPVGPTDSNMAGAVPIDESLIVVTGTRQVNRTVAESLSPIQVLGAASLQQSGKLGLQEILSNVLPSFTLPSQAGGDLSNIIRVATLRGLNPDHTLILVDGKRRHPGSIVNVAGTIGVGSQATDLNLIPQSAISRIEVLTDGAAAQYGSDAIAGVINIILKGNDHGGSIDGQIGQYYEGDGKNGQIAINTAVKLGERGFLSLSGQYINQENTDRAVDATITPLYYAGDVRNSLPAGKRQYGYGIPKSWVASVAYNMKYAVTDAIDFYSFGTYGHQRSKQWQGYRAPNNVNNVIAIYPEGFQPKTQVRQDDYQVAAGLKGADLAGFAWDLSSTYGRNKSKVYVYDTVNGTYGTASPTDFYAGSLLASQWTSNLDLRRSVSIGLAKPLGIAVGAEVKRDGYAIGAGQVESYARGPSAVLTGPSTGRFNNTPGAQAFPGFRPDDVSSHHRTSIGGYGDLETSLTDAWEVGLAGRYEHYSDFGDNVSGKFSTRYAFSPAIAVRGTVSNGFRAPTLGQQFYSTTATSQYLGVDYNVALKPVTSAVAQVLGAQPLKAEKSFNLGAGLVLNPLRNFTITVDAYQIKIDDRIVLSANIGLNNGALNPTVASLLAAQGIEGVSVARYFLNGANTRTRGVDIVSTYNTALADGRLTLTLAGNFNRTKVTSLTDQGGQTLFGTQIFNQVSQDQLALSTPRNKQVLSASFDIGRLSLFARQTRFGTWTQPSTVTNGYSRNGIEYTTDAEVRYKLTERFEIGVGAQNLFNNYPDRANAANFAASTFNGANIYNAATPFGLSGGNYYARLHFAW